MTPRLYWASDCGRVRLFCGDVLDVAGLPDLPEVGAVVTDPPYSSGGMFRGDRTGAPGRKYSRIHGDHKEGPPTIFGGDNKDQWSHTLWSSAWMGAARELCAPTAPLLVFTDWRQIATQMTAVQWGGWVYRGLGVWDKGCGRPNNLGGFGRVPEFAVHATAGASSWTGVYIDAVCRAAPIHTSKRAHIAQKPAAVADWLAGFCPVGGVVLDPFCGSGALLAGALRRGCSVVGLDLSAEHLASARELLSATLAGLDPMADPFGGA
jgi:site-specific DNA-methyltransferase (adenine-specific)